MKIKVFSANNWIYPDTQIDNEINYVFLDAARGGMACFQLLTDKVITEPAKAEVKWSGIGGVRPTVYQLIPVCVDRNSGAENLTGPYEAVKEFVTREAPFMVYDAMRDMEAGMLSPGRLAFYVRIEADKLCATGIKEISLEIEVGGDSAKACIELDVHKAIIPPVAHAKFGMVNWLNIREICSQHRVDTESDEFEELLAAYIDNEVDMRNTQLQLPSGVPVRDENGKVIGFDFSLAAKVGNMALERGFQYVMGGFVARFEVWNEETHYLLWDRSVSIASHEGYRQLKLYFTEAARVMKENGWEGRYMQTLVDEPQFPNSDHYRILSSICRKFLPGVPIHDPVESTQLDGALEIWDVKQAVYEKYLDEYQALQELGEEMWLYTCGFPAGKMMNRAMDLPLTASILPMWLCYMYGCKGFLHWGYNVHTDKPFDVTCYMPDPANPDIAYPAGNAHIVYPGKRGPMWSVRAQLQRAGAEDYELLYQLGEKDRSLAMELIHKLCRNFSDYTFEGTEVDLVRKELLKALDD